MNIYLAVALAFTSGIGISVFVARKLWLKTLAGDRLIYTTNQAEQLLRHSALIQLHEIEAGNFRLDAEPPSNVIALLRSLGSFRSGVLIGQNGTLRLPNGGEVRIGLACREIEQLLMDAYKALDEAAGVILEYAESLPAGTLEGRGQVLHSKKYAFESEIVRLAFALGLDPDKNDVAMHGGAKLWQRWSAKLFSK